MDQQLMGILNIYKEKGWTSFDVVNKIRYMLGVRKVGHTGTLDPEAEGVLPVCVGKATKVVDLLTEKKKTYKATCQLGIATDTQDHTGRVINELPVNVTSEEVINALESFIGETSQIPPMYSALKIDGKRLYELARQGKVVNRKPRNITVYNMDILDISLPNICFTVTCSKGTYIRTICHDLGEKLGTAAHMTSLLRTEVASFYVEESIKIPELAEIIKTNSLENYIIRPDQLFMAYPEVIIQPDQYKRLYNGNNVGIEKIHSSIPLNQEYYRIYNADRNFIGIYKSFENDTHWLFKAEKLFI